jgi:HK97 family phage major capsid protein
MNKNETLIQKREMLRTMEEERKAGKLTEERAKEYDTLLAEYEDLAREVRMEEVSKLLKPFQPEPEQNELRDLLVKAVEAREQSKAQTVELRANETMTTDVKSVTPLLFQQLMRPLHEEFVLNKLGGKVLMNVQGEPIFPSIAALDAQFVGEAVALTSKKISLTAQKMTPKRVGISLDVTSQAINQSNVNLPTEIVEGMGTGLTRAIHQYIFSGTAVGGAGDSAMKPVIDAATQYAPADLNLKLVVGLESKLLEKNFVPAQMKGAYVMGAKAYCALKSTPVEKGNPQMLIENDMMNGYPVIVTNFITPDAIIFGCWDYLAVAQFGTPRLVIDPISQANKDVVRFTLNTDIDAKLLLPDAFVAVKAKAGA